MTKPQSFILVCVQVGLVYFLVGASGWHSSTQAHTIFESIAALLAAVVGVVALVRFYWKHASADLLIAIAFLGAALLDGYHAAITSAFFAELFPTHLSVLIPWSWTASRTFLALLLLISLWCERNDRRLGPDGALDERLVYGGAAVWVLLNGLFLALPSLPRIQFPGPFVGRPFELLAATLFALALAGYLAERNWRGGPFRKWLVSALVLSAFTQAFVMSRSFEPFDAMFDAAHALKIISYACVLAGFLADLRRVLVEADLRSAAADLKRDDFNAQVARRKQAEEELGQRDERINLALMTSNDGMYVFDAEESESWWSPRFYELLGYEEGEISPSMSTWKSLIHEDDLGKATEALHAHIDGTAPYDMRYRLMTKSGRYRWFHCRGSFYIDDSTNRKQVAGSITDIHRTVQAEQELERHEEERSSGSSELERFIYVAAHDLQEPARTLESYAGFLREDINAEALDGEAATDLRFIEEAAQRRRSYINDLLALSRAGSQALSRQRVPIESCVSSSLKALQQRVDTAQAQLTYGQLPEVIGDRRLITILFENLISNALKFSGETPPAIEVTAYTSGEMWTLGVRDNGIGLEEEHAQDVFEPFRRLHGLTEYPGSGMGLAVSRKIVERHGGEIWVESKAGAGAHFKFTLPAADL